MIDHRDIGNNEAERKAETRRLIAEGVIKMAGYRPGKIYGTLTCSSGKRMKMVNRVFFSSEQEAIDAGYRPCGHCLPEKYKAWKRESEVRRPKSEDRSPKIIPDY